MQQVYENGNRGEIQEFNAIKLKELLEENPDSTFEVGQVDMLKSRCSEKNNWKKLLPQSQFMMIMKN